MSNLLQDLRYGLRMLIKNRSFTAVSVIALALGIGANTAIFSAVNAILLQPLPYKSPDRLLQVWESRPLQKRERTVVSPAEFLAWREQAEVFERLAAVSFTLFNLTGTGEPEQLQSVMVSASFFPMLGVEPIAGRHFLEEEDQPGRNRVVILSYALWQRRFGGASITGQPITLNGNSYTVVGIMPPSFNFPQDAALWTPIAFAPQEVNNRGNHYLEVYARLKPNVTGGEAQSEMARIAGHLEQSHPETNRGHEVTLVSLHEQLVEGLRPSLVILIAAVAFVLLIACANIANLLLARASARQKEIAIRTAMGASRWRIIRQLLAESVLLAGLGGVLGLFLAWWGIDVLVAFSPENTPRINEIRLDASVFGFALAVSLVTGVLFGLAPAWQASKPNLNETLKEGGRGSTEGRRRASLRNILVVSEIALTLVLMVGAGLMLKSFYNLRQVNLGFDPSNLLTIEITLTGAKYAERPQYTAFYDQLFERIETAPGVRAAAAVDILPLSGNNASTTVTIEGQPAALPGERPNSNRRVITINYFNTMGMPVLEGRAFTADDATGTTEVAIINETMAARFWPGQSVLGQRFKIGAPENNTNPWLTVVGVVADIKHASVDAEARQEYYRPFAQNPARGMFVVTRTATDPLEMVAALRGEVLAIDPEQPIGNVTSMEQLVENSLASRKFSMLLLGVFAALAITLASVGVYGVISYSVAQRRQEIGIRMALGASSGDVLKMVIGKGMRLVLVGIILGLAAAWALTSVMSRLLYQVSPTDLTTFAAISLILATVALLACAVPARRATKVDPMIALRYE
jgi:putative ABC transport system permease protein